MFHINSVGVIHLADPPELLALDLLPLSRVVFVGSEGVLIPFAGLGSGELPFLVLVFILLSFRYYRIIM